MFAGNVAEDPDWTVTVDVTVLSWEVVVWRLTGQFTSGETQLTMVYVSSDTMDVTDEPYRLYSAAGAVTRVDEEAGVAFVFAHVLAKVVYQTGTVVLTAGPQE